MAHCHTHRGSGTHLSLTRQAQSAGLTRSTGQLGARGPRVSDPAGGPVSATSAPASVHRRRSSGEHQRRQGGSGIAYRAPNQAVLVAFESRGRRRSIPDIGRSNGGRWRVLRRRRWRSGNYSNTLNGTQTSGPEVLRGPTQRGESNGGGCRTKRSPETHRHRAPAEPSFGSGGTSGCELESVEEGEGKRAGPHSGPVEVLSGLGGGSRWPES